MKVQSIKGTKDIIWPEIAKWHHLEQLSRKIFEYYGYQEIRTPIIEQTSLFRKSIGTTTDIVKKEMYTFTDRASRSITLRPEETASIVRAYLEHKLYKKSEIIKLYYMGPMFRCERPQAGRSRQFHQLGVEAIGSYEAYLDIEIIALMHNIVTEIGLRNCKILLNSLGCTKDRSHYKHVLKDILKKELAGLCKDCKQRYAVNPLRILDCKNEDCQKIINKISPPINYLCEDCQEHFEKVKNGLGELGVPYSVDTHLVRGLDYYTRTTFELTHSQLGAKNALCAGGRYDNLISDFGGPQIGACGFAFGIERTLLACEAEKINFEGKKEVSVYIATVDKELYNKAFKLTSNMRRQHINAHVDYQNKSLKAQLRQANKLKVNFVIIIGEEELKKNKFIVKDMEHHMQWEIEEEKLLSFLHEKLI